MIYFLQPSEGGPVKIGCSVDVARRLERLKYHYKRPLTLLATMEGGPDEEAAIHARFDHLRLSNPGRPAGQGRRPEQFRPAPELMEFIGRPLPVGVDHDAVEMMTQGDCPCAIRLELSREHQSKLRVLAAEAGMSMAAYARSILIREIDGD